MDQSDQRLLVTIEAQAREQCADHDAAHDVAHLQRVLANATLILHLEPSAGAAVDPFVVHAASWLHDAVQLPKGSGQPGESARRSADFARALLASLGVAAERAEHVADAVRTHSYSGGERPATLEAAIVQDADRLDALGAVGIARLFIVAGTLDSHLYDPDDPLARDRPLADTRFALDHIAAKLVKLPDLMHTSAARQIAAERLDYVLAYRAQFLHETSPPA